MERNFLALKKNNKNFILFALSVLFLCASAVTCAVQTRPAPPPEITQPAPTTAADPTTQAIYDFIYTGDFKTAKSLITSADPDGTQLKSLTKIIDQYNQIQTSRQEAKQKIYAEQLTKAGVPHHAMTVRGDARKQLEQLANLMGMRTTII